MSLLHKKIELGQTAPRVSVCCVNAQRAPVPRSLSDSVQGNSSSPEPSVPSAAKTCPNWSKSSSLILTPTWSSKVSEGRGQSVCFGWSESEVNAGSEFRPRWIPELELTDRRHWGEGEPVLVGFVCRGWFALPCSVLTWTRFKETHLYNKVLWLYHGIMIACWFLCSYMCSTIKTFS